MVDAYANLLPMMYPLLTVSLGLNYSQVGLAIAAYTLSSSLSQPIFGYIADKIGGRHMAAAGVVWMATMLSLLGFAWDYWSFVALLTVAGFGTAAFHPQGAMNTAGVGGDRRASAMSIYMLGGNTGYALGPMIGALVFSTALGLRGALFLWLPGVVMALWLYKAIGKVDLTREAIRARADKSTGCPAAPRLSAPLIGVVMLVLLVMLRSWAASAVTNFVPLWFEEMGLTQFMASRILFVILIASAAGGVIGAFTADAFGRKKVTFISLAAAGPALFAFFQSSGVLMVPCALLAGFLLGASTAVTLVMGQELLPQSLGVASGLILGLAFAAGGVGVGLTGALADSHGLHYALNMIGVLPLIAAVLCLLLNKPARSPSSMSAT